MINKLIHQSVKPRFAAVLILIALLGVGAVEMQALKVKEQKNPHEMAVTAANCLKCHFDAKSINLMRLKEGGMGPLFKSDGTFTDPHAPAIIAQYQREAEAGKAYRDKP